MTTPEKRRSKRAVKQKEVKIQRDSEKAAAKAKAKNAPAAKMQARVTRGELLGVQMTLQNHLQVLQQQTSQSVQQLWQNDGELRDGNRAAEFNLRAHQKVLNAFAVDLTFVSKAMQLLVNQFVPEENRGDFQDELVTTLKDIEYTDDDGSIKVVRRINWIYYHELVEEDLKVIAEQEAAAKAVADAEAAKAAAKPAEPVVTKPEENDQDEVAAAAAELLEQTRRVAEESGKMARGEPYDKEVIAEAQRVIDEDEAKHGDTGLEFGSPAKEEEPQAAPPIEDGYPEGAAIFGGE